MSNGRVLLIGDGLSALKKRLVARGLTLETSCLADFETLKLKAPPDAVVVSEKPDVTVPLIRGLPAWHHVPVVVDARRSKARTRGDGAARTLDELESLALANVAARQALAQQTQRLVWAEAVVALGRHGALGEGVQAALTQLQPRLPALLGTSEVSVLMQTPRGHVLLTATAEQPAELSLLPGFMTALQNQLPTRSGAADYVPTQHQRVQCLSVTRERPLDAAEVRFVNEVLEVLAFADDQATLRRDALGSRQSLEAAYIERFRELNQANERLKAVDRKKNEIVAMLSHDLRAPLNVVTGHAYLMETDPLLPASLLPSVAAIKRTTGTIVEMIEGLLDANRGDGEKLVLFSKTIDVAQTVIDSVRQLQVLASQKGLLLKAEAPMSLEVHGDELKIRQVLQNLITNSLQHASGAKTILVRARLKPRPDGDVALVEVSDDGSVADPEQVLLAFDRSRGLGLAIARSLIERHGGEIWAEAPKTGGAQFCFTLPLRSQPRRLAATPGTRLPLLLIADRDPVLARAAQLGLSGHYRVSVVRDGLEVISRAVAEQADVILMDLFLPNRDALQIAAELRSHELLAETPVLLMTSNPEAALKARETAPANTVLVKPFHVDKLMQKLDRALNRVSGRDVETGLADQLGFARHLAEQADHQRGEPRLVTLAILRPLNAISETRLIARELRLRFRHNDVLGHFGRGLFVAMLPETSRAQAEAMVSRVLQQLAETGQSFSLQLEEFNEGPAGVVARFEQLLAGGAA